MSERRAGARAAARAARDNPPGLGDDRLPGRRLRRLPPGAAPAAARRAGARRLAAGGRRPRPAGARVVGVPGGHPHVLQRALRQRELPAHRRAGRTASTDLVALLGYAPAPGDRRRRPGRGHPQPRRARTSRWSSRPGCSSRARRRPASRRRRSRPTAATFTGPSSVPVVAPAPTGAAPTADDGRQSVRSVLLAGSVSAASRPGAQARARGRQASRRTDETGRRRHVVSASHGGRPATGGDEHAGPCSAAMRGPDCSVPLPARRIRSRLVRSAAAAPLWSRGARRRRVRSSPGGRAAVHLRAGQRGIPPGDIVLLRLRRTDGSLPVVAR